MHLKPLVVTLHGMKPFDSAGGQIYEWQQEADRYGFVVCAPELDTPALGSPLPLSDPNSSSLKRDEGNIVAIMNELCRTHQVDPAAVFITSWSYGGYLAHYLANRNPEKFRAIAVRQSNFSASLLDEARVPQYRDHRVGIFYTENDFAVCRRESHEAAEWYARHGFDVTFGVVAGRGHERAPSLAAAFFAKILGIQPQSPPVELAQFQVRELPISTSAPTTLAVRHAGDTPHPPRVASKKATPPQRRGWPEGAAFVEATNSAAVIAPARLSSMASAPIAPAQVAPSGSGPTHPAPRSGRHEPGQATVQVNAPIGLSPLWLNYSATLPGTTDDKDCHYTWYLNGKPLSNGLNGEALITQPGDHLLHVVAELSSGALYQGSRTITVLARTDTGKS